MRPTGWPLWSPNQRVGGDARELEDGLEIRPRPLHGGRFGTYHDHRMVMAAATLGLAVRGRGENVATVGKTCQSSRSVDRNAGGIEQCRRTQLEAPRRGGRPGRPGRRGSRPRHPGSGRPRGRQTGFVTARRSGRYRILVNDVWSPDACPRAGPARGSRWATGGLVGDVSGRPTRWPGWYGRAAHLHAAPHRRRHRPDRTHHRRQRRPLVIVTALADPEPRPRMIAAARHAVRRGLDATVAHQAIWAN